MYVIGDVHGCFNTLLKLIKEAPKQDFIFIGDLVDKGLYSYEVINFVMKNNYKVIKGNHEELFSRFYNKRKSLWYTDDSYGGRYTIDSFKGKNMSKYLEFIDNLPYYIQQDNYFLTHGFGLPYYNRKDNLEYNRALMSNRVEATTHKSDWEDYSQYNVINIFGHSAFVEPLVSDKFVGIDTGAVYGNKLSMIELGSNEIISIDVLIEDLPKNYADESYRLNGLINL